MSDTLITVHALALLACPVVAVGAVVGAPRKAGQKPAGVWALVWPVLIAFLPATMRHLCDEGQAVFQWLIPLCCLWLVAVGVGHIVTRRCVAMVLAIAMWVLTYQFDRTVHERDVTGNPNWDRIYRANNKFELGEIANELTQRAATDAAEYPKGWVRELPFAFQFDGGLPGVQFVAALQNSGTPHGPASISASSSRRTTGSPADRWQPRRSRSSYAIGRMRLGGTRSSDGACLIAARQQSVGGKIGQDQQDG